MWWAWTGDHKGPPPRTLTPLAPTIRRIGQSSTVYSRGRRGCGCGDGALESCLGDRYSCPSCPPRSCRHNPYKRIIPFRGYLVCSSGR